MISRLTAAWRGNVSPPAVPFVCIGAQKAGTTWLYSALKRHPDIWLPPIKELHYFNEKWVPDEQAPHYRLRLNHLINLATEYRNALGEPYRPYERAKAVDAWFFAAHCEFFLIRNDASYREYFQRNVKGAKVFGEITPDYMLLPQEGFANIQEVLPDVRLLFIMRDPVTRYWSELRMLSKMVGKEPQALASFDRIIPRSDYQRTITAVRTSGVNNFKIILYEDLFANPEGEMAGILEFLGLPSEIPARVREAFGEVIRKGERIEPDPAFLSRIRDNLASVYDYIRGQGFKIDGKWAYA